MNDLAGIERVVLLQTTDLFRFCKAEEILRISALAHERRYGAGEEIYGRNEPADTLFCLVRGSVRLEPLEGEAREVGPLQTFGVVEILSGRMRSETATAASDALALAIDADDFFDLLSHNIEIVKALFRQLLGEQRRARAERVA
jgi:CRP/FNR family transcriptional regulator, cyclic AMP receptor protein